MANGRRIAVVKCGQTVLVTKCVQPRILHHLVYAVVSNIVHGQGRLLTQLLLDLEVPLLIARVLDATCDRIKRRWSKARHAVLNAGKRPTRGERGEESSIALGSQLVLVACNIRG